MSLVKCEWNISLVLVVGVIKGGVVDIRTRGLWGIYWHARGAGELIRAENLGGNDVSGGVGRRLVCWACHTSVTSPTAAHNDALLKDSACLAPVPAVGTEPDSCIAMCTTVCQQKIVRSNTRSTSRNKTLFIYILWRLRTTLW